MIALCENGVEVLTADAFDPIGVLDYIEPFTLTTVAGFIVGVLRVPHPVVLIEHRALEVSTTLAVRAGVLGHVHFAPPVFLQEHWQRSSGQQAW